MLNLCPAKREQQYLLLLTWLARQTIAPLMRKKKKNMFHLPPLSKHSYECMVREEREGEKKVVRNRRCNSNVRVRLTISTSSRECQHFGRHVVSTPLNSVDLLYV